ncbi:hypothetical protein YPPY32_4365, partial [Yersinia pestis PY-32]
MANSQAR